MSRALGWWRHALLAGVVAGLLASPHLTAPPGWLPCLLAAGAAAGLVGRPLLAAGAGGDDSPGGAAVAGWFSCLAAVGALAGLGAGNARVTAIERGAFSGPAASEATATGFVGAVPRRSFGEVRFPLDTPDGKLMVVAREPVGPLPVGAAAEVRGGISRPADPFRRAEVERIGASLVLDAESLALTGAARGGVSGVLDRIRGRAEVALGEGADEEQAALARGFVLGEDDLIDPQTREEFKRSGLAHLLRWSITARTRKMRRVFVESGQNERIRDQMVVLRKAALLLSRGSESAAHVRGGSGKSVATRRRRSCTAAGCRCRWPCCRRRQ